MLTVQVGAIAEDQFAVAILVASQGSVSVATPLADQGFDGYIRRVGSLDVAPYQLKARRTLTSSGSYVAYLPVRAIRNDPHAYLVLAFLTPPDFRIHHRLWIIPVPYFLRHCPRDKATGRSPAQYVFRGHLNGRQDPWSPFLTDLSELGARWLHQLFGSPAVSRLPLSVSSPAKPAFGTYGELWLAAELERLGTDRIVVARERVDVDTVDLLLHGLRNHRFTGLQVKTATIESGRVQFNLSQDTFFVDERLFLIVLPCHRDGSLGRICFMLPSEVVPAVTSHTSYRGRPRYQGKIRVDQIQEQVAPHAVATEKLGSAILRTALK